MNNPRIVPAGMEDDEDDEYCFDSVQKTCENMKITIVPDITINAGINNENFDATLSSDIQQWFDSYREMWNVYKKTPSMVEMLRSLYLKSDNPLLLALKLFANCPGCSNVKNKSLPYLVLEIISTVKINKPDIISKCDVNMKMIAFNFVKNQGLPNLYKLVAKTYELIQDKNLFEDKLKSMIEQHNYKDVSHWAVILNLTDKFGLYDLILPLILQDKISLAEDYLDNEKALQQPTIELLDSLLEGRSSASVLNKCSEYIVKYKYPDVKLEKIHPKPLMKLIVRLSKKYNITIDQIPNVQYSKSLGYMQYLIYKKYVDKSMNNESWHELILDTIPNLQKSKDMQLELITSIAYNCDWNEALYWIKYYHILYDELPLFIREYIDDNCDDDEKKIVKNSATDRLIDNVIENFEQINHEFVTPNKNKVYKKDGQEVQEEEKEKQIIKQLNWDESWDDDSTTIKFKSIHNKDADGNNITHKQNRYYSISDNSHQIRSYPNSQETTIIKSLQSHSNKFYQLKLGTDKIQLIENSYDFEFMLNDLKNTKCISFDTEWTPTLQFQFKISLIQLAKYDKIYLIDVQSKLITKDMWLKLSNDIFNNCDIIKIGFSINQDIIMLQKLLTTMNIVQQQQQHNYYYDYYCYIDLQELWKKLLCIPDFQFPYKSITSNETLSQLVEICLGKKLDKSNQFSNWGKRPLRKDQIIYAALDAHCLLEIYNVIRQQLNKIGIDIIQILNNLNIELKNKPSSGCKSSALNKTTKGYNRIQNKEKSLPLILSVQNCKVQKNEENIIDIPSLECNNIQPIKVSEIKFICDNMLEGLAKGLRKFGINCLTVTVNTKDCCAELALKEQCYLLTKGHTRYTKFSKYLAKGQCYRVQMDYIDDQITEIIKYFNIIITESDIFSRCQLCNCNEFIFVTNKFMKFMKYSMIPSSSSSTSHHNESQFNCIDDKRNLSSMSSTEKSYNNYDTVNIDSNIDSESLSSSSTPLLSKRNCIMNPITSKLLKSRKTEKGASIQLDKITQNILGNVKHFYVCEGCGKCYWDGSHWEKIIAGKLKNIITKN